METCYKIMDQPLTSKEEEAGSTGKARKQLPRPLIYLHQSVGCNWEGKFPILVCSLTLFVACRAS